MKITTILSTAIIASMTFAAVASNTAHARGGHGGYKGGHGGHKDMLSRLDSDGDGLISPTEFTDHHNSKHANRHFSRMDKDGDNLISQSEYEAYAYKHLSRLGIDEADMDACMKAELGSDYKGKPSWTDLTTAADSDGDSMISEDEMSTYRKTKAEDKFADTDINADGFLDADEITSMKNSRKAHRSARRTCIASLI